MKDNMRNIIIQATRISKPSSQEKKKLESLSNNILEKVNRAITEIDENPEVVLGGSYAKGTWLKQGGDIDIFVKFDSKLERDQLENIGLKIGLSALKDHNPKLRYSEHPYVEAFIDEIRINIVACYNVDKGKWKSAADRSPHHTDLIIKEFDENMKRETILLKLFMKSLGIYGAEIKTRGFSGYVCEVLILKYGKLTEVLDAAPSFLKKESEVLNVNGMKISNRNHGTIIITDPIDSRRNLGTAISTENISTFMMAAGNFMKKPSMKYFYKHMPETAYNSALIGNLLVVLFKHQARSPDILWGQLRRSITRLRKHIEKRGFKIIRTELSSDEDVASAFIFLVEELEISGTEVKLGPDISRRNDMDCFLTNLQGKYLAWFGEDGRVYVLKDREETTLGGLLKTIFSKQILNSGIAPGLVQDISDNYRILTGLNIKKETVSKIWLREGVLRITNTNKVLSDIN